MCYEVEYIDGEFWIVKNGEVLEDIGGFIDPVSPEIIIKEIKNE